MCQQPEAKETYHFVLGSIEYQWRFATASRATSHGKLRYDFSPPNMMHVATTTYPVQDQVLIAITDITGIGQATKAPIQSWRC